MSWPSTWTPSTVTACGSADRLPSSRRAVPAFTPETLTGSWDTIVLATKAHHTDVAVRALVPHLTAGGCVVSAQNGLNELAIAEVGGSGADDGRVRQLRRRLPGAGCDSLRRPGRRGRRRDRRTHHAACHRGARRVERFRSARHRDRRTSGAISGARKPTARCSSPQPSPTNPSPMRSRCPRTGPCTSRWRARSWPLPPRARFVPSRSTASSRRRISRRRHPAPRNSPSMRWSRTIADRRSRTAASGAISPCASGPPRWTPSSASW